MEAPPSWSDSPATMLQEGCDRCMRHVLNLLIVIWILGAWWAAGLAIGMAIPCPRRDDLVCLLLRNAGIGMVILLAAGLLVAWLASCFRIRLAQEREARTMTVL